mgnify:CR=1 FL=1
MTFEAAPTEEDQKHLVNEKVGEAAKEDEEKTKILAAADAEKKKAFEKELDDVGLIKTTQAEQIRKKVLGELAPYVRELKEQNTMLKEMVAEYRREHAKTGPVAEKSPEEDLRKIYPDMFEAGWLRPVKTA